MTQKRNGFFNFCFSCIPGAGQMFQGFLKKGVSIMLLFFGIMVMSVWIGLDEILFCLPVIWFYGFFDAINTNSMSDEEFVKVRDEFLFVKSDFDKVNYKKFRIPVAIFLIFVGTYGLMKEFLDNLIRVGLISWDTAYVISDLIPRTVFSIVVVAIGIYLIHGKRTELQNAEGLYMETGTEHPEREEGDGE